MNGRTMGIAGGLAIAMAVVTGPASAEWVKRAGDLQNTGNMGSVPTLGRDQVTSLKTRFFPTGPKGVVNVPPLTENGLLYVGDWDGQFHVFDLASGKGIVRLDTGSNQPTFWGPQYQGIQSAPALGEVTTASGERTRVYFGATSYGDGLWCVEADAIEADRETLLQGDEPGDGTAYVCPGWPKSVVAPANIDHPVTGPTENILQGSMLLSVDQPIDVDGDGTMETRDVIYTPTTGLDCGNGQVWAMDADSGEIYWAFDPVVQGDGLGGTMWYTPAMSADRKTLFIATGNCINKPQVGELAESVVALDASSGTIEWFHQRRLIDTADMDVGNGPTVVDHPSCSVVISPDKDGCLYAFPQAKDSPGVGDLALDPMRLGQQRLLWRRCFAAGGITGGFNAGTGGYADGVFIAQLSPSAGSIGEDDATTFGVDPCTGDLRWASSSPGKGFADQSIANGLAFFMGRNDVQILDVADGTVVATVDLGAHTTVGGGGMSISEGALYVPVADGVVEVTPGGPAGASAPRPRGTDTFAGPYPVPVAPVPGGVVMTEERALYEVLPQSVMDRLHASD